MIIDDVYSSFMEPSFQLSGFEEESRVIIDSFSKKFALPGLRLGYTVIPENDKKYFRAVLPALLYKHSADAEAYFKFFAKPFY